MRASGKHKLRGLLKIMCVVPICAVILLSQGCSSDDGTSKQTDLEKTYDGNSTGLERTAIVPTLDTPIPKGKNVIWCSSFQIAWNELKNNIIGAPVQITDAEDFSKRLNMAAQSRLDLPDGSYYADSGFVKDGVVERIQSQMAKQFPSAPTPQFDGSSPAGIIAYSYLAANVRFKIPFFENREAFTFTDSQGHPTNVTSFGIREGDDYAYRKLRKQVDVLFYSLEQETYTLTEFAIDLCRKSNPNQIVIAQIQPKDTLTQTLKDIEQKIAKSPNDKLSHEFSMTDILLVPNIFWEITHHFQEIEGKYLTDPGYQTYYVATAIQMIQFRLDRSGAELKSEAGLALESGPKYFVLDRPFLIYMKKRGAKHPYFVMWIDNAELLSKPNTP